MTWCAHAEEVGVLKAANPLTNLQHVTPYFLNSLSEVEDKVRAQDLQRDEEKQKPLADRFRRLGNSPFLAIVFISLCLCPEYITMEKTKVPSHTHAHTQREIERESGRRERDVCDYAILSCTVREAAVSFECTQVQGIYCFNKIMFL